MANLDEFQVLTDRVFARWEEYGFDDLDHKDKVFFLVCCHAGQVDNGGHDSFFYNHTGEYYPETLEALSVLGLDLSADLLRQTAELLFAGVVSRSHAERNDALDLLSDDDAMGEALNLIDEQFFAKGGGNWERYVLERWYLGG